MNTFSTQEVIIFMAIVFVLLLILMPVLLIISRRSEISNKPEQTGDLKQVETEKLDERKMWGKISMALATTSPPELEIEAEESPRYRKMSHFFTVQERKFYELLYEAVGDNFRVFAKVRMADVLYIENEPIDKKYFNNHIRCRHFDFILCEPVQQKPIIAIELDDSSHHRYDRKASDDFKDLACRIAKLQLLRIKLPYAYSREELLSLIQTKVENA
jgi:hypothetical protein